MSIAKVIEVIAESDESWEDAAQNAIAHASVTVKDIKHLYVKDLQAIVDNDKIVKFRLNCNLTFMVRNNAEHVTE